MRYKLSDYTKIKTKNTRVTISQQHLAAKLTSKGWSVVFANKSRKKTKQATKQKLSVSPVISAIKTLDSNL